MTIDPFETLLFTLAAVMLLGSPGPGIAALIAVGRNRGMAGGLPFFGGLQIGLALAAGISAAGLFSAIEALPFATAAMMAAATLYLVWLAWRIASAPVGRGGPEAASGFAPDMRGGFLLGITNPKSYIAFVSLMASYTLVVPADRGDALLKWAICVVVMIAVDLAWLWIGAAIGRIALSPAAERAFNIVMGGTILGSALIALA